jgi:hypothetical protein
MASKIDTNSIITVFDRTNSWLQNTIFRHRHDHWLCTFTSDEQEPACRARNLHSQQTLNSTQCIGPRLWVPYTLGPEDKIVGFYDRYTQVSYTTKLKTYSQEDLLQVSHKQNKIYSRRKNQYKISFLRPYLFCPERYSIAGFCRCVVGPQS